MATFKLACHLIQFAGEERTNPEKVLREVAEAGWDGAEAVIVGNGDELVTIATLARRFGLHLVNVADAQWRPLEAIKYNITLGNDAAEIGFWSRQDWGGSVLSDEDVERAARSMDEVLSFCVQHGVKGFHHAHLGMLIETVEDAERLLAVAPDLWLLYDTGHLLAAGSDPLDVLHSERLRHRIGHVHLKDFHADDPATWNRQTQQFEERARFAELGAGNTGLDILAILTGLEEVGYAGWISVELDAPYPPRPAAEAARVNREYLRRLGY